MNQQKNLVSISNIIRISSDSKQQNTNDVIALNAKSYTFARSYEINIDFNIWKITRVFNAEFDS